MRFKLAIFVIIIVFLTSCIVYFRKTADPETLRMIGVFMDDFRFKNITEMPHKPPPLMDNLKYYISRIAGDR